MASPISFTIELRRCWTTDRVMGSILADIITRSCWALPVLAERQSTAAISPAAPDAASMIARIPASVIGVDNAINPPACQVYSRNTIVPTINPAAMNSITAGNP